MLVARTCAQQQQRLRVLLHLSKHQTALGGACLGGLIGTIKRSGGLKARGVKQGFKGDISATDGSSPNCYSHVAKVASARTLPMGRRGRARRIAIKGVATAFLQPHKCPPGALRKHIIHFKHPTTGETMCYRQHAPIYGENSAPVHWENTLFPFLTDGLKGGVQVGEGFLNFTRGDNTATMSLACFNLGTALTWPCRTSSVITL